MFSFFSRTDNEHVEKTNSDTPTKQLDAETLPLISSVYGPWDHQREGHVQETSHSDRDEDTTRQNDPSVDSDDNSAIVEPPPALKTQEENLTPRISRISQPASTSPSTASSSFATLSIHHHHKIRMLKFPNSQIIGIRKQIQTSWPKGIQKEGLYGPSWEFILNGQPLHATNTDFTQILLPEILCYLYTTGWLIETSTNPTLKPRSRDTLIFRHQTPPSTAAKFFTISFYHTSRIRIAGAEREIISALHDFLSKNPTYRYHKEHTTNNFVEFKFKKSPWMPEGRATVGCRQVLIEVLEGLSMCGCRFYTSFSQGGRKGFWDGRGKDGDGDGGGDGMGLKRISDVWYCVREC